MTVAVGTKVLMLASSLTVPETAAIVFYLALSLTNISGLLEGERWSLLLERRVLSSEPRFSTRGPAANLVS